MKGAQDTICLESLRSILVCLYSLMFSEAIFASGLVGLLGPKTDYKVMMMMMMMMMYTNKFNHSTGYCQDRVGYMNLVAGLACHQGV